MSDTDYIGKLRRSADGALDSLERRKNSGQQVGWQQDWWKGYKQALDDLESQQDSEARAATEAKDLILHRRLQELDQLISENVRRGFVNTVEVRQWIEETAAVLPPLPA